MSMNLCCNCNQTGAHRVPIDCVYYQKGYKYILKEGKFFSTTREIKLKNPNSLPIIKRIKVEQNLLDVAKKIDETLKL